MYCKIRTTTENLIRGFGVILVLFCLPETDEITGDSVLLWSTQDGNEKVDTVCWLCFANANQSFAWVYDA